MLPSKATMDDVRLNNPMWHALIDSHAQFAVGHGRALRFPADIGPFVAIETADAVDPTDLLALVEPGETVDFVGAIPALDEHWQILEREQIAQMQAHTAIEVAPGPPIRALGADHAEAMLALTRLVYPGYYRPRTRELGAYIGIVEDGRLAAMAGERLRFGHWQEISAVCTHPDHLGRGHAQRLVATLVNAILARGDRPFLHVSNQNLRAIAIYQRLGFSKRADIELCLARRV